MVFVVLFFASHSDISGLCKYFSCEYTKQIIHVTAMSQNFDVKRGRGRPKSLGCALDGRWWYVKWYIYIYRYIYYPIHILKFIDFFSLLLLFWVLVLVGNFSLLKGSIK